MKNSLGQNSSQVCSGTGLAPTLLTKTKVYQRKDALKFSAIYRTGEQYIGRDDEGSYKSGTIRLELIKT